MFRLPSLHLGRVLGIPIEVNVSWFVVFVLIGGLLSFSVYPSVFPGRPLWVDTLSGFASALLFFTSLVAHEFSHSMVARRFGIRVERITLFIFGGVAQLAEEPRTPGREFGMAVAGPAMSLVLCAAFGAAAAGLLAVGASDALWGPAAYLSFMNLCLAVFNLAPGFPMDGGRVLRAYLWWATGDKRTATFVASAGGVLLALAMSGFGAWVIIQGDLSGSWMLLVGLFLGRLAIESYRRQSDRLRLASTAVGSIRLLPLPTTGTAGPWGAAPASPIEGVLEGGVLVGVAVSGPPWPVVPASGPSALITRDPALFIDVTDSLDTALTRFEHGAPALIAVKDSRAIGVVTAASFAE